MRFASPIRWIVACLVLLAADLAASATTKKAFLDYRGVSCLLVTEPDGSLPEWYHSPDYWHGLLDLMERSGLNRLDIWGVYPPDSRKGNNLLPYLAVHPHEQYAHRPVKEADSALTVLRWITQQATTRNIQVGLINAGHNVEPLHLVTPTARVLTRLDLSVNFDWKGDGPAPNVETDHFAIRWSGVVVPRYNETYTFLTQADDGTRLWIDGKPLIDDWGRMQAVHDASGTIRLEAGQRYELVLEYLELQYAAAVRLLWESASQPRQVIPTDCLRSPDGEPGLRCEIFTQRKFAQTLNEWALRRVLDACPQLSRVGCDPTGDTAAEEDVELYLAVLRETESVGFIRTAGDVSADRLNAVGSALPGRTTVLAAWNGAHLGLPYPALRDGDKSRNCLLVLPTSRTWRLVWHLGGATHRVFPWFWPDFIRDSARNAALFGGTGFSWEPIGSAGPQACHHVYLTQRETDLPWRWLYQRDALTYQAWGLFSRNPDADEQPLYRAFEQWLGTTGPHVTDAYVALIRSSRIVPTLAVCQGGGPSADDFAPEHDLRSGHVGIDHLIHLPPLDPHVVSTIAQSVRSEVRESLCWQRAVEETDILDMGADTAAHAPAFPVISSATTVWLARDLSALATLARSASQLRAAARSLEIFYQTGCPTQLEDAAASLTEASHSWHLLVRQMTATRTLTHLWEEEIAALATDERRLAELQREPCGGRSLLLRHVPVHRAPSGQSLALRCRALGDVDTVYTLQYKPYIQSAAQTLPAPGGAAIIPGSEVQSGTLAYHWIAQRNGQTASWPAEGWHPVMVTGDRTGPRLHVKTRKNGRLDVRVNDDTPGIRIVRICWFPLTGSGAFHWSCREFRVSGNGSCRSQLPEQPCAWRIEAADPVGNVTYWPAGPLPYRLNVH